MTKKKRKKEVMKRGEKISEIPIETVTTTTDAPVEVMYPEDETSVNPLDILKSRVFVLERKVEDLQKEENPIPRLDALEEEVRSHAEHLPIHGTSHPRRHNTYEVQENGENIVKIAKSVLGSSGRYVEILALNGITLDNELKKGQVLDIPIQ